MFACCVVEHDGGDTRSLEPPREWSWVRHVPTTRRQQVTVGGLVRYSSDIGDRQAEREVGGLLPPQLIADHRDDREHGFVRLEDMTEGALGDEGWQ